MSAVLPVDLHVAPSEAGLVSAVSTHARRLGIREIALVASHPQAGPDLHAWCTRARALAEEVGDRLQIRLGLEVSFAPGPQPAARAAISAHPWDFVLGLVRTQDDWCFDDPGQAAQWDLRDVDQVFRRYYGDLRACAASGLCDVVGAPDLIRKLGHRPAFPLQEEYARTAQALAAARVAVEVNTRGLRDPVAQVYPPIELMRALARFGVPVTVGSGARVPDEMGAGFEVARQMLQRSGYTRLATFRQRRREEVVRV